ncbi:L-Lysine-8-amino-7-oxononanoate aminotransferase [Pirellulimonas nuda]|uniref:Adenosylmethionine-8-amino-7-oxononanoate aminotransferase n=1 Tax=Pirellulimonas nuda TaxID=2528009 RepID=A0A518DAZ7_9BACT|nr:adenosylmethionine--8-amino-7-oxononanoate transaminase [Pirellulimonas nuda]QDU88660.1 L-Lysine-8-amino-7-oxononanoate aminotransferase [Pirellulimonas nuda]
MTNRELHAWDRTHLWHSFTQMAEYEPLVIRKAEGCYLVDIEGRRYLDAASSMWCAVHGHRHPTIDAAIRGQLDRVAQCTSLGMGAETAVVLAKRLADLAPGDLDRVFFASDGASATEVALKTAFQYWRQCDRPRPQKTKFLAFREAYHGDTLGAASVSGIERFTSVFQPLLFDTIYAPLPDPRRLPAGTPTEEACAHFLDEVRGLLEQHAEELVAVVIEPLVQCAAGMVMHPHGFLAGLRQLTQAHDLLLIADEVAVGMGRTGTMFACDQESVAPDLLCLGKGLSGGYLPLSAMMAPERIWQAFLGARDSQRALDHGHTFSGNPLACAAAMGCLDVFEQEQTLEALRPKIARIGERLCGLAASPRVVGARQRGMIAAFDLTLGRDAGRELAKRALQRGVWLRPQSEMVYVMPPLSITLAEIDKLFDLLTELVTAL